MFDLDRERVIIFFLESLVEILVMLDENKVE